MPYYSLSLDARLEPGQLYEMPADADPNVVQMIVDMGVLKPVDKAPKSED